jgi:hypothetical protein
VNLSSVYQNAVAAFTGAPDAARQQVRWRSSRRHIECQEHARKLEKSDRCANARVAHAHTRGHHATNDEISGRDDHARSAIEC